MSASAPVTLAAALLAAQQAVRPVGRTGRNVAQGWAFLEAHEVIRAARDALHTAGLVAVYRLTSSSEVPLHLLDGYLEVHHPASGEVMRLPMPWPIDRAGPQARRAAFTYATKQSLLQLLAIPEPDDPETAAGGGGERDGRQAHPAAVRTHPTREQVATLRRLLVDAGYADPDRAREWAATTLGRDVTDAADLSAGEVDQLLTSLAGVVRGARDTATGDDP